MYCHRSVISMLIDLEDREEQNTREMPGFCRALLDCLPGLGEHHCSRGRQGGFLERLEEGTYLGHVVEHVALELQASLDYRVFFGRTQKQGEHYQIIFEFGCAPLGRWAGEKALHLVKRLLLGQKVELNSLLSQGKRIKAQKDYGPSTEAIIQAAREKGVPCLALGLPGSSLIQLGHGHRRQRLKAAITDRTSCVAVDIACDKWATRTILQEYRFPFAPALLVESWQEAKKGAEDLGYPLVIKPSDRNHGRGITAGIQSLEDVHRGFQLARKYSPRLILEQYVEGQDYRLLIVAGKLVAASRRMPPHVVGDGESTVAELIDRINDDPLRGEGHENPLTRIKADTMLVHVLNRQGRTIHSIPQRGEIVYLRDNGNLSTGGTAQDVTPYVHEQTAYMACRATTLLGLDIAGVDIMARDISRPLAEQNGVFLEINASPGLRMHHFPEKGSPRPVATSILEHLFPGTDRGRIPIVAITGSNGKTTVSRMVAHILEGEGYRVGLATTEGIFIDGQQVLSGDCTGPRSAKNILSDPVVEAAVLETARGGILREGLGYDWAQVGIITNITEDHLDGSIMRGLEDLWRVKSLIAERILAGGYVVINGDDPFLQKTLPLIKGRVVLCSQRGCTPLIEKHVQCGGLALYLQGDAVLLQQGAHREYVLSIKEVPITWEGQAPHQVENTLLAAAGAMALGIPVSTVRRSLTAFDSSHNPGRLELVGNSLYPVILDYGHNCSGFARVLEAVYHLPHERLLGVVGMPGDRQEQAYSTAGKFLARCGFQHLWIKEDEDCRGRRRGDVAARLKEGLVSGGFMEKIDIVFDEKEAVERALQEMRGGDVLVVFYEKDRQGLMQVIQEGVMAKEG